MHSQKKKQDKYNIPLIDCIHVNGVALHCKKSAAALCSAHCKGRVFCVLFKLRTVKDSVVASCDIDLTQKHDCIFQSGMAYLYCCVLQSLPRQRGCSCT